MNLLIADTDSGYLARAEAEIERAHHHMIAARSMKQLHERMNGEEEIHALLVGQRFGKNENLSHVDELRARYPEVPLIVCAEHTSVEAAVLCMKKDAEDYIRKSRVPGELQELVQRLEADIETPKDKASGRVRGEIEPLFQSKDPKAQQAFEMAFRAAATDASILILGPNGTGKTVLAKEIHRRSERNDKPFVTVSCPSLSEHLLESELFGHVKGAFTGAVNDSWGKVHAADSGTLFLDEIGDMSERIQPRLLRLLQEKTYERLGETTVRDADLRVISATNCPIQEKIQQGEFREDLMYRLNVISVKMLPLRERVADLPEMIHKYLTHFCQRYEREKMTFTSEAMNILLRYTWPGNLREMANVIERSVILAENSPMGPDVLPPNLSESRPAMPMPGHPISLEALTGLHIQKVLEQTNSMEKAASILGIDTATLYRKRKKMGLI